MTRTLRMTAVAVLAAVLSLSYAPMSALADDRNQETSWILVTPAEAAALATGDDSIMDQHYDGDEVAPAVASRASGRVEVNPDGCKLTVASVHWRESSNYKKIGYKPTVKCDRAPVGVSLRNELQKYMFAGWWKTEHTDSHLLTLRELNLTTKKGFTYTDLSKSCNNQLSTNWRGKTSSTIKATNGRTYYARQFSAKNWRDNCGT